MRNTVKEFRFTKGFGTHYLIKAKTIEFALYKVNKQFGRGDYLLVSITELPTITKETK